MKKIIIYLLGVFAPLFAHAQLWEVGVMLGGSNYSGDLSPGPIVLSETHPAIGGLVRYNVNKQVTLKGNIYYGTISGSDAANAETKLSHDRNLSFQSNILDIGGNLEYNFMKFEAGSQKYRTAPYGFIGLSIFKFDPEAYINGTWVRLQPLGTEGQGTTAYNDRKKYALSQISIPFGLGLKHNFAGNWNIGLELGWRKTFTDYLDDVSTTYPNPQTLSGGSDGLTARLSNRSREVTDDGQPIPWKDTDQRGNSTNDDWYMFGGITLTYTIMNRPCYRF